jgi:hypothetical protein
MIGGPGAPDGAPPPGIPPGETTETSFAAPPAALLRSSPERAPQATAATQRNEAPTPSSVGPECDEGFDRRIQSVFLFSARGTSVRARDEDAAALLAIGRAKEVASTDGELL